MKTSPHLAVVILVLFVFSNCSRISQTYESTQVPIKMIKDLPYGKEPQQTLDLLMPVERNENTKVLIFLHGGSWKKGDKEDYNPALKAFAARGMVIVNMNYRLAEQNKNKFPVQMDDITSVIELLKKKSKELGFATNRIGLAGHSAGAHLALLYSYRFNTTGLVKAVAALAPVSDLAEAGRLANKNYVSPIINFLGKQFAQDSTLWIRASPYWMASAASIPTILFHGISDKVVPVNQSVKLEKKLESLNVPSKLIEYKAGHVWLGNDLVDTRENLINWMNLYLN